MFFSKKWKFCLFGCLLFFACKSADCGCPMAENTSIKKEQQPIQKGAHHKNWAKISK